MIRFKHILVVFQFGFLLAASANQEHIDSLKKVVESTTNDFEKSSALIHLSGYYSGSNLDSFLIFNNQALDVINKSRLYHNLDEASTDMNSLLKNKILIFNNIGVYHYYKSNVNRSLEYYNKALEIANQIGDESSIKKIKIYISLIQIEKGDFSNMYTLLSNFLYVDQIKDPTSKGLVYSRIAYIFYLLENYEQSLVYTKKQLELARAISDSTMIINSISGVGVNYLELGYLDSAHYYINTAFNYSIQKNMLRSIIINQINLAEIFSKRGEHERAKELKLNNIQRCSKENVKRLCVTEYYDLISYAVSENKLNEAEVYMRELESLLPDIEGSLDHLYYYESKLMLAEARKEWEKVHDLQKNIDELKNILNDKTIDRKLVAIELKRKEEREKKLLKLIHELEKREEKNKRKKWIYGSSLFVFLLLTIIFIYFKIRKRKIKQEHQRLEDNILLKDKELTSYALRVNQSNEYIQNLGEIAKKIEDTLPEAQDAFRELKNQIKTSQLKDKDWLDFQEHFNRLEPDFVKRLKRAYPSLTPNEIRLCSLLRLNIPSHEIAYLLNIQKASLKRTKNRINRKINLKKGENLADFILRF